MGGILVDQFYDNPAKLIGNNRDEPSPFGWINGI